MDSGNDGMNEKTYGSGLLVGIGYLPRVYIVTVGKEGDDIIFVVSSDEKTRVRVFKGRMSIEDVSRMMDEVVKEIMEEDKLTFVELLAGTGMLKMTYMRRLAWA